MKPTGSSPLPDVFDPLAAAPVSTPRSTRDSPGGGNDDPVEEDQKTREPEDRCGDLGPGVRGPLVWAIRTQAKELKCRVHTDLTPSDDQCGD